MAPIVQITYTEPLFTFAAHPTEPIIATGLATGHVSCFRYNPEVVTESIPDSQVINTWKTKRHKGSCRCLLFDPLEGSVGKHLYSVGSDHVIKKADTATGKVRAKVSLTLEPGDAVSKLAHAAHSPFLLAGTENGHVLVYDSTTMQQKFVVKSVHDDSINHILPMSAISEYHYLTLGSTTLSHIDIRKGVITQSDDQEDELLSMAYTSDSMTGNKNDTVLVGHGEGIVTIWKNSKNKFQDQLSRIKVNKGVSIDCIIPTMSFDNEDMRDSVWCGDSDGMIHRVNYKKGKVVERREHGEGKFMDEVGGLDLDYEYRLISGGMERLVVWGEGQSGGSEESEEESEESEEESEESEEESEESEEESEQSPSDLEPQSDNSDTPKPSLVKRKRLNPDTNAETKPDTAPNTKPTPPPQTKEQKKQKQKQKQQKSHGEHGIRKFDL